ncbi:restriction endonuclease [Tanticharoenia sakaeratensis]|uniref:restriction endonuclease n=1 Tax=Tanticharoenia sakaeratensis TaxID=444053 RepID=UPI001F515A4C|nr:restriction endonuclease [Tanticharoenia sakaeratensis]
MPANAQDIYHPAAPAYACVNPRATRALANHADPRQNDSGWVRFVISDGRCFMVSPSEKWEAITSQGGMLLLRRDPPRVGMPPLSFLPAQVVTGAPSLPAAVAVPPPADTLDNPAAGALSPAPPIAGDTATSTSDISHILPEGWQKPRLADPDTTQSSTHTPAPSPDAPNTTPRSTTGTPTSDSGGTAALVIVLIFAAIIAVWWVRRRAREQRLQHAWQVIDTEIESQASALQVRRIQLATPDHYGTVNLVKWHKEIEYFCSSRLVTILSAAGYGDQWPLLSQHTYQRVEEVASRSRTGTAIPPRYMSDPRVFDPRMDPIDYERHCALLLEQAGWDARVTQASGDQGADVIAIRNGMKIVVQCKLYSSPVGNKAVQEAYTAKQHQGADAAIVVTNAEFTPQARQLASTTGVYLLHHQQLPEFAA